MPAVRAINDRPYSIGRTGIESVGRGLGPAVAVHFFGGSKPPPYVIDCTALEFVGEGLDPPGSRILRFFNIFGKMIPSYKSVILSERSESKDLGSINNAKILRLRFTPLRMTRNGVFCVSTWVFSEYGGAVCAGDQ